MSTKEKRFNCELFKDRLQKAAQGDDQKTIAEKIGVPAPSITKWISGKSVPSTNDLMNISAEYGCSIDYLVGTNTEDHRQAARAREVCEILLNLIRNGAWFDVQQNADRDVLTIGFSSGGAEPYTVGSWKDALVIDFFKRYQDIERLQDLPEEYKRDLITIYLDRVDEQEMEQFLEEINRINRLTASESRRNVKENGLD